MARRAHLVTPFAFWVLGCILLNIIFSTGVNVTHGRVAWVWLGGVEQHRVVLTIKLTSPLANSDRVTATFKTDAGDAVRRVSGTFNPDVQILKIAADGLEQNTTYSYRIDWSNNIDGEGEGEQSPYLTGRVRTLPAGPSDFSIAFASCSDWNMDPNVFSQIRRHNPLLFLHLGDLHYGNIANDDIQAFRGAYDRFLLSPGGQEMLKMNLPMAYMWDDHDFGPDNSDKTAPGREAAAQSYREYVPHYPILDRKSSESEGTIQQQFTVGRVRFILTDLRYDRDPNSLENGPEKTVLGTLQKAWFKRALLSAGEDPGVRLIVWCSTMPWIGDRAKWGMFQHERSELARFFTDHGLASKMIIVSGDAHMLAVDDGSHSAGGVPVFHAAALGRPGSVKGGPYSHGAFPGTGQFGVLKISDDPSQNSVCVRYSGYQGERHVLEYDTCHPERTPGRRYDPPLYIFWWIRKQLKPIRKLWRHFGGPELPNALSLPVMGAAAAVITVQFLRMRLRARRKKINLH